MCACLCVCEYPFMRVILLSSMKKSEGGDYACLSLCVVSCLYIFPIRTYYLPLWKPQSKLNN